MPVTPLDDTPGFLHVSVMLEEVISAFSPMLTGGVLMGGGLMGGVLPGSSSAGEGSAPPMSIIIDATAGGGGHSEALLERYPNVRLLAFDRDTSAVQAASARLARFGVRARVTHSAFSEIGSWLDAFGIEKVDGLMADLGVSSPQLTAPERGMSFRAEGPLDMRMDPSRGETALELMERVSQDELANIIYELGEERGSRRIARCIKQALLQGELHTTLDLRRAVVRAMGPRRIGGVDPATRTFQALRIAVNRELDELASLLSLAHERLAPGGTAAFISFHSLEDRLVKRAFAERTEYQRVTPKPLIPTEAEQNANARSRSAKLRVARRLPASLESK
ncbi:MAG TPA: 16S rRNA (cytosine(1402)-N(4))-methyltransferase RsmH [Polyangiaceae bacterium]|nr:16S rRNA (cytosine(1402)-N(4))-methyltransferase RsmH [Polyangiaceae bacterium]